MTIDRNVYLITGFSGFVAYHFVSLLNKLAEKGTQVIGLDRCEPFDYDKWNFSNLSILFFKCDLTDYTEIEKIITTYKPTNILHLAAFSSVGQSWRDPAECFINNTSILLNMLETIRKNNIKCKMVCVGSSEEYGSTANSILPLKESMPLNPENPYAVTKMSQEAMCNCYVKGYNLNICMTRSFNHVGPRQRDVFVLSSFVKQVAQAVIQNKKEICLVTGNIDVSRDFLDVRDVVYAYYLILQKGIPGELYNVCSGKCYKLREIIAILSEISGVVINTKIDIALIRPNEISIIYGSNDKINHDIGWKPVYEIRQSIEDVYNYWKDTLSQNN